MHRAFKSELCIFGFLELVLFKKNNHNIRRADVLVAFLLQKGKQRCFDAAFGLPFGCRVVFLPTPGGAVLKFHKTKFPFLFTPWFSALTNGYFFYIIHKKTSHQAYLLAIYYIPTRYTNAPGSRNTKSPAVYFLFIAKQKEVPKRCKHKFLTTDPCGSPTRV